MPCPTQDATSNCPLPPLTANILITIRTGWQPSQRSAGASLFNAGDGQGAEPVIKSTQRPYADHDTRRAGSSPSSSSTAIPSTPGKYTPKECPTNPRTTRAHANPGETPRASQNGTQNEAHNSDYFWLLSKWNPKWYQK